MSNNGKTSFDEMMSQFASSLSCTLKIARKAVEDARAAVAVQNSDTAKDGKELTDWEKRKARVTAALIPGLKKIVDSEFGPGAGAKISRVERMYERIGRNEVYEETSDLGQIYAPGFVEDLQPKQPWHDPQDYAWSVDLCKQWKAIRSEFRDALEDEDLWTSGAYAASNEAYGKDWKIMGVLTADQWRDEKRFKVTSAAIKKLCPGNGSPYDAQKHARPFEAFFAKMPAHTTIDEHSDNLNYILTTHLALDCPEGCFFKVGEEERPWKEGEMLVVDTSYNHSAVNNSDKPRYVLVMRFWHPGLTPEELRAIQVSHAILAKASEKK
jgi:hypothetical protein